MASLNKVILIGNLGKDPDLRYTPSGQAVCEFSLATTATWTDKGTQQRQTRTDWHNIIVWGAQGENSSKYLKKGRQACVEGRIQTRSYEKDGVKHYRTEIIADRVVFLGSGPGAPEAGEAAESVPAANNHFDQSAPAANAGVGEDDLPF